MTDSELLTMMIGGMAHIAGGVMAVYIGMLAGADTVQQHDQLLWRATRQRREARPVQRQIPLSAHDAAP